MHITKRRIFAVLTAVLILIPSVALAASRFVDVANGKFYEAAVNWADSNNITTGSPAGSDTFKPDDPVTRGESVTFLKRYHDNVVQPSIDNVNSQITQLGTTISGMYCDAGQLLVAIAPADWSCKSASLITQRSRGASASPDTVGNVGQHTSIAIGSDDLPIISYYESVAGSLKVFHCNDIDCRAGVTTIIDPGGTVIYGKYTSIVIGTNGLPIISYQETTGLGTDNLRIASCTKLDCSTFTKTSVGTVFNDGGWTSIARSASGSFNPLTSEYDRDNKTLVVATCSLADCSTGASPASVDVQPGGDVGSYSSIAVDSGSIPGISYYDAANGDLKFHRCGSTNCTGGPAAATITLDGGGSGGPDVGLATSMAFGTDNYPIISYYDATNGDLKVFHCNTIDCVSGIGGPDGSAVTVDSTNDVGSFSSMVIGNDGLPIIAYYDATNTNLKVFSCSDTSCSGGSAMTLDKTPGVGQYPSIAIGVDGLPIISYWDATNNDLKVIKVGLNPIGISFN